MKQDSVYNLQQAEKVYRESGLPAVIDLKIEIDSMYAEGSSRAYHIASAYGMIGEDEQAMDWLEKAFNSNKASPHLSFHIHFKKLHNNPRYIAILENMGLASL